MRKMRRSRSGSKRAGRTAVPINCSASASGARRAGARAVGWTPRGVRTNNSSPNTSRNRFRAWEIADCVSPRRRAAAESLPLAIASSNASRRVMSSRRS
jgi:hypothetical protein